MFGVQNEAPSGSVALPLFKGPCGIFHVPFGKEVNVMYLEAGFSLVQGLAFKEIAFSLP